MRGKKDKVWVANELLDWERVREGERNEEEESEKEINEMKEEDKDSIQASKQWQI